VTVQGPETSTFCVLLGGSSFSLDGEQECWPSAAPVAHERTEQEITTTDLRSAQIEVVESKCEQRLRIGSDVLFDFDQAETRGDAAPTLTTAAQYLKTAKHAVRVEGHTDGKGTDAYNQMLSEKRADSARSYLVRQGVEEARLSSVGFGETRPVAPNTHADGSDDPAGRQKNRRVEIVLDTCERTVRAKD
jgi:outer membrane protein OmpA-like peptidoglycan-associated protein